MQKLIKCIFLSPYLLLLVTVCTNYSFLLCIMFVFATQCYSNSPDAEARACCILLACCTRKRYSMLCIYLFLSFWGTFSYPSVQGKTKYNLHLSEVIPMLLSLSGPYLWGIIILVPCTTELLQVEIHYTWWSAPIHCETLMTNTQVCNSLPSYTS